MEGFLSVDDVTLGDLTVKGQARTTNQYINKCLMTNVFDKPVCQERTALDVVTLSLGCVFPDQSSQVSVWEPGCFRGKTCADFNA